MRLKRKVPETLLFKTYVEWDKESGGRAVAEKSKGEVFFDTPKDFGGKGRYACPDEIFLASLGGCLINTFLYLARKYIRYIKDLKVDTECEVKLLGNRYVVSRIKIHADLIVLKEWTQYIKLFLETAYEHCHLIQLVKNSTNLEFTMKIKEE